MSEMHKCEPCGYEWKARAARPKRCPYCNRWLPGWKKAGATEPAKTS